MKTTHLRINQLSPEAYERYLTYLQAMDDKDEISCTTRVMSRFALTGKVWPKMITTFTG